MPALGQYLVASQIEMLLSDAYAGKLTVFSEPGQSTNVFQDIFQKYPDVRIRKSDHAGRETTGAKIGKNHFSSLGLIYQSAAK